MLSLARQLALLSDSETQVALYIVVGIIIIEGIWLAYLTFMMWRKHRLEKKGIEPEKAEPPKEEPEKQE